MSISYRNRNENKLDKYGKKKPANWEYRFDIPPQGGKRVRITKCGFSRKQDAIKAGNEAYNEYMNGGRIIQASDLSYSDVLDRWMEDYCKIECNDTTYNNYSKKIELHIKPALGKYAVTSVTADCIQRFINGLVRKEYSRNTISVIKGIISKTMKYAKRMKWIRYNECSDVELPSIAASKKLRSKKRIPVSREDMKKILDRFPEGHSCHLPLLFGHRLGTRIGEAFAFQWNDIDLEKGTITVNHQMQWYKEQNAWRMLPPKYDSIRTIDMDREMISILRRERLNQKSMRLAYGEKYTKLYLDDKGFLNEEGRGNEVFMVTVRCDGTYIQPRVMQHCSHIIHTDLECPDFDFHSLRHTHATELAEAGVSLKEIQRRLGHKSMILTDNKYVHPTEAMREESIAVLNAMYRA